LEGEAKGKKLANFHYICPSITVQVMEKKKVLRVEDFSPSLFWDVDKAQLDFEKHAVHVVDKAINRGSWEDFQKVLGYYGRKRVKAIVKNLRYMDKMTMQFSSVYFQIPITEMRCYIWRQSNPSHWDY
jgi:hypothetical protein